MRTVALVAAIIVTTALSSGATAHAQPVASPLGVDTNELNGIQSGIVAVSSGVPLFVGGGTTTGPTGGVLVLSAAGFSRLVSSPSPLLLASVDQFFAQGGSEAWVVTTSSESASALTAALTDLGASAQDPLAPGPVGWDMVVVPALGTLGNADWLTVAAAATSTASVGRALALLDPPDAAVTAAQSMGAQPLVSLAQQLKSSVRAPGSAVLLSSGFSDGGAPMPGAAVLAGIVAATDLATGPWAQAGGLDHPVVGSLSPNLVVDDDLEDALFVANIGSWRIMPGYGTIFLGSRTLSDAPPTEQISVQRTTNWISASIAQGLQTYVFQSNTARTWAALDTVVSEFLSTLWAEGALYGATPSQSFSVAIGLGSTMTAQDILNGQMVLSVQVHLSSTGNPVSLQFTQTMGT